MEVTVVIVGFYIEAAEAFMDDGGSIGVDWFC